MPVEHTLKTLPESYDAIYEGLKTWDFRKNDRNYQVGDTLRLLRWSPVSKLYTGEEMCRQVTWMLDGGRFGVPEGYCIMSLSESPAWITWKPGMERPVGFGQRRTLGYESGVGSFADDDWGDDIIAYRRHPAARDLTTEREKWDECHARQFEKNADYLRDLLSAWVLRGEYSKAHEISLKIRFYEEAAQAMRQPKAIREEREQLA